MAGSGQQLGLVGASLVTVGLSTIVKLAPSAYQYGLNIKIYSGGGTLEIIPPPLALSGVLASGWGQGYPIGSNESVHAEGALRIYLAATGATMTAAVMIGYTQGITLGV